MRRAARLLINVPAELERYDRLDRYWLLVFAFRACADETTIGYCCCG